ncbi:MAG TPA: nitroreductase family protein [Candidatus Dormibacteraeota bacterium]|nr:nitroreductase family protein [Candidatus Dormibacteraeota bacterium]
MDVFEAIHTTRAMRRLDPGRPVADADLRRIVEAGTKAATGGNSQPVRWVVVTDSHVKRRLGEVYRRCATKLIGGDEPDSPLTRSSLHLAAHLGESPALLIACTQGERKRPASVFPAVQNVMLAARALGLGTTLTTSHLEEEAEVRQILQLPDDVVTYCMIPVGYPLGRWGEAPRAPVEDVTFRDRWGTAFRVEP